MLRRSISFVLIVIVAVVSGYQLAYHRDKIEELGGITGLVAAVAFVGFGFLVVFWPDDWRAKIARRIVTAFALIAFLVGGEFIRESFTNAPFATLAWGVGLVVVYGLLYVFNVFDHVPGRGLFNRLRSRLAPAPATP